MIRNELLDELLKLPERDRVMICEALSASLPKSDPDLTPEERAAMLKQLDEFRAHPERFATWDEVKNRLRAARESKVAV